MKCQLMSWALLFNFFFLPISIYASSEAEVLERISKKAEETIVVCKFNLDIVAGQQERSQESLCLGTLVDPSGIVMVANSSVNPMRMGMSIRPSNFRVVKGEKTYTATLIYKDAEKNYAFLRMGHEEDVEEAEEFPEYHFEAVDFNPRPLKMGDSLFSFGRYPETYEYSLWYAAFSISGVITTPKLMYGVSNGLLANTLGTPAFDLDGKAVGIVLLATVTTATGQIQPTQQVVIRSVEGLTEVIESLPAPGEEEVDEEEEYEEEFEEEFDSEYEEDLELDEEEGSGG